LFVSLRGWIIFSGFWEWNVWQEVCQLTFDSVGIHFTAINKSCQFLWQWRILKFVF